MPALQSNSWLSDYLNGCFDMKSGTTATMGIETQPACDITQEKDNNIASLGSPSYSREEQQFVWTIIGSFRPRLEFQGNLEMNDVPRCRKVFWGPSMFGKQVFVFDLPDEQCIAEFDEVVTAIALLHREADEEEENIWSPVFYPTHPRRVLFKKEMQFNIKKLPRWRPSARVEIFHE